MFFTKKIQYSVGIWGASQTAHLHMVRWDWHIRAHTPVWLFFLLGPYFFVISFHISVPPITVHCTTVAQLSQRQSSCQRWACVYPTLSLMSPSQDSLYRSSLLSTGTYNILSVVVSMLSISLLFTYSCTAVKVLAVWIRALELKLVTPCGIVQYNTAKDSQD